jgi:alpha-L-rhamnosidase
MKMHGSVHTFSRLCTLLTLCIALQTAQGQPSLPEIGPPLVPGVRGLIAWPAEWLRHPDGSRQDFGIFHFRKPFNLTTRPDSFIIHVSADNRYRLYVNGSPVSAGPAVGDLEHWRYETIDIAEHLQTGQNVLAAVVWNFGEHRPVYQITQETGFILAGNGPAEQLVNTGKDSGWKVLQNDAYTPIQIRVGHWYYVVGPGEKIDGARYPWGWREIHYDDSDWTTVAVIGPGRPARGQPDAEWQLMPRPIPLPKKTPGRFPVIRRQSEPLATDAFLRGHGAVTIPANTTMSVLLDNRVLTTAWPEVQYSGGRDAQITLWYAEALTGKDARNKGNRNEIDGKSIVGNHDIIRADGGTNRTFVPLYWRTFRYVQLDIETSEEPLTLNDMQYVSAHYPFESRAQFACDDERLSEIWDVAFRTLLNCSYETYVDCPYYEQISYNGDTRTEALTSYYVSGDDRLGRNALMLYADSRPAEGLTHGRYPVSEPGFYPSYSLEFVKMVYDYYWYRDDPAFVRKLLPATRNVLQWMEQHIDDTGMLGAMPGWNYIDMAWKRGEAPGVSTGGSAILSLSYARALRVAGQMETALGWDALGLRYRNLADRIIGKVMEQCWVEERQLLADTPERNSFSQHANLLAVLLDAIPQTQQRSVMETVLSDASLSQCQLFYQFFLHRAVRKVGLADRYVELLQPWFTMLDDGLSTFAEFAGDTRSDCHAWSSHPMYHMQSTVAGIESAAPGFAEVRIAPNLGPLTFVKASMPHPAGTISVDLQRVGETGIMGTIILPDGITGAFEWQGKQFKLQGGSQVIDLP